VVSYEWRGPFRNAELSALHAAGFGSPARAHDWQAQLHRHSLGWVCARDDGGLAGFVNVAWDGGAHAFLLDTVVTGRHQGAGTRLVAVAAGQARAAGCAWLHVDFEAGLGPFYWDSCGFRPTSAGLIALGDPGDQAGTA
jgi:GNAT superfamily N-acetyltransferase